MRFPLVAALVVGLFGAAIACGNASDDPASSAAALAANHRNVDADDAGTADTGASDDGNLTIIVEPSDRGAALVAAIRAATTSVHMTMYELTDYSVINALVARHKAGLDVKVILNQHFDETGVNPNATTYTSLQTAGVPVVWAASTFLFTHEKCVVIDGTAAWIMTMNATESSPIEDREYLAVDGNAPDIAEAEAQFEADFAGTAYTPTGPLLMSPVTMRPGLVSLIYSATQTLDFEVEELNDAEIADALCAAVTRGVVVRGVLSNATLSNPGQTALNKLKACNVKMGSLAVPYIHAKAIVVDGVREYVGSANFSTTSLDNNRELGLITTNAAAITAVNTALGSDIAAATAL